MEIIKVPANMVPFDLQFFTGENRNKDIRTYNKQFAGLLQAVFDTQAYFAEFLPLQIKDGIAEKDIAFTIKANNTAVTVGDKYVDEDTDENVAFGTGTGNSTRFGPRTEVKYVDIDVPYAWQWVIHEGIDRHTVNEDFDAAVADRLDDEANAKVEKFDDKHGSYLETVAAETIAVTVSDVASYTKAEVISIFDQLSAYFVNAKVKKSLTWIAKVNTALYNGIINNDLVTTAKGSSVNIDRNEVQMFKRFVIDEIPDDAFSEGVVAIASVAGVGVSFTGINTARTIESEDFDGVALQGAGKAGEYVSVDNRKAIAKVLVAQAIGSLTVASAAGTAVGDTKITITEPKEATHIYKYKVGEAAQTVTFGQNVKNWTSWDGTSDITAATGKVITVVEASPDYDALKYGYQTVTAKANG